MCTLAILIFIIVLGIFLCLSFSTKARHETSVSKTAVREIEFDQPSNTIFSLTTLPSRAKKIDPTIQSLLDQTTKIDIEIHIPEKANPEPNIPYEFSDEILHNPRIKIIRHPEDLGPSMKFIPAIKSKRGDRIHIISVDDDMIYPRTLAQELIKAADKAFYESADEIFCTRGNKFKGEFKYNTIETIHSRDIEENHQVAIVTGCGGFIIPCHVVDKLATVISDYSKSPIECKIMDDVWISGIASDIGIKKYVIPKVPRYKFSVGSYFTPAYLDEKRSEKNQSAINFFRWSQEEKNERVLNRNRT